MKRFFSNFTLLFGSLVLSAAGIELAMRIFAGQPVFAAPNYVNQALDIVRANSGAMSHHTTLGWMLLENIGSADSGFSTGPLGIRTNGRKLDPLPRRAVIAVGDSFTAGSGVRDSETWPAQLEALLGRPVINGGTGAYGVDQMVLRAEQLADTIVPEAIVVGVFSQDSLRNAYDVYGGGYKPWFGIIDGKPELRGVPVPKVDDSTLDMHWTRRVFGYSYTVHHFMVHSGQLQWWVDNESRYRRVMSNEKGVEVSCALMQRLEALRVEYGTQIIVVMLWGAQEAALDMPPWYGPPVIECAKRFGFGTLDLHGALNLLSKDASDYPRYWVDEGGVLGHPAKSGHAITARLLFEEFFQQ